jgi:hypothetical protein
VIFRTGVVAWGLEGEGYIYRGIPHFKRETWGTRIGSGIEIWATRPKHDVRKLLLCGR